MRVPRLAAALTASVIAVGLLAQAPARAMTTESELDGGAHPAVVALLYINPSTQLARDYCSGMLITQEVVLSASHCTAFAEDLLSWGYLLAVSNDSSFTGASGSGFMPTTSITSLRGVKEVRTNTLYEKGYRDDVSALVLDSGFDLDPSSLGVLPTAGLLDTLTATELRATESLVLGYGSFEKSIPANGVAAFPNTNARRSAILPTISLDKQWIHQDQNVGKNPQQGGACYGDSGGPSLMEVGGSTYVVGVTSTGDGPCLATNVASRVDTPSALAFIYGVATTLRPPTQ